ncbi:MAG TPA: bifunctional DNA primase/polymerase [Candidatus Nanoarchaeia archaeon]
MQNNEFIHHSLKYLQLGFSVIPIDQDKKPLVKWEEYQKRKATEEELRSWAQNFNNPNIGIVTGDISGMVVVDVEAGGDTTNLAPTILSKTGGGGYHFFYKHPGQPVKNGVRVKDKTDIRGDGGYVVVPPSVHKSGNSYEWLVPPDKNGFAPLPKWVLDLSANGKSKVDWQQFLETDNQQGSRNMTSAQLAGKLLHHLPSELWETAGWAAIVDWNQKKNKPALDEVELRKTWESIKKGEAQKRAQNSPEVRTSITFEQLEETIHKWLLIKDPGIIKVLVASVIANKLPSDPVWLFIVTASGGTKTELIRGLAKVPDIYSISDLTPQSFLSGEKSNKNASLLLRLPREVILTLKDFTTVLTMHRDKRHAILSQLREIYDGQFKKEFGTGETKEWEGKLGFIAGVTPVIDTHYSIYQTLGERFIQYRPRQSDPIEIALKAMGNSGKETPMREEIQNAFADFIAGVAIPEEDIAIPEELTKRMAYLAAFCVRARSGVIREGYSHREIELIPDSELPTRLAKQLITLACALYLITGEFTEEDYELVYKVGMDSLPQNRKAVIDLLYKTNEFLETTEIATKIGYPTNTTRRVLEDLHGLKLILRESKGKGFADRWAMLDKTTELLEQARPKNLKESKAIEAKQDYGPLFNNLGEFDEAQFKEELRGSDIESLKMTYEKGKVWFDENESSQNLEEVNRKLEILEDEISARTFEEGV